MGVIVLLAERFEVVQRLGEGSFGIVYEVIDRDTQQRLALKLLRAGASGGSIESRDRFRVEFRALQDLSHPNLVVPRELGEHDGALFFTMELVDGTSFVSWVRTFGDCNVDRLRDAFGQLLDGLAALHAAKLVHRDVKPRNALVRVADGRVAVLDFGLIAAEVPKLAIAKRRVGELAEPDAQTIVGTPMYMAPEQHLGGVVGPPADCFAAGVMLYKALTGSAPFTGTPSELAHHKLHAAPAPLPAEVPSDLAALCRALLAPDPQSRPTASAALAVLGREPVRVATPARVQAAAARLPFIGRHGEFNQLAAHLAATRRGATRVVLVRGESGIGKSTLARRFAEDAAETVVLWSRCYERETVPFKAVDGLVDGLTRAVAESRITAALSRAQHNAVAQMFPALGAALGASDVAPASSRETRIQAFTAIRALVEALARGAAVMLIVDDLQWTDLDSLELLANLVAPPDPPPLLLLGCVRDDAAAAARAAALRALPAEVHELVLGPLDRAAAGDLVREVLGRGSAVDPQSIVRDAGGHPLFAIALARDASEAGRDAPARSLADLFAARLARLPDAERRLVEIVCLAHGPLPIAAAREAAGLTEIEHAAAVLRVNQLIRTSGPREQDVIEPYHDRVRVAVAAGSPIAARPAIHAAIARALEHVGGADPAVLALHCELAGDLAAATRHVRAAAEHAMAVLAFERAARLYQWVLELDPGAPDRGALHDRRAAALASAGRSAEAADANLEAALANPADAVRLRRRAMHQLLVAGQFARGLALLDELAAVLGVPNPRRTRRIVLGLALRRARIAVARTRRGTSRLSALELARIDFCFDAALGLGLIDAARASYFQTINVSMSLKSGDPQRRARALVMDTVYHAAHGPSARSERYLARCDELAGSQLGPMGRGWALLARGISSAFFGAWRVAHDSLVGCAHLLGRLPSRVVDEGVAFGLLMAGTVAMRCAPLFYLGRLRELRRFTDANLRDALHCNDLHSATHFRTGIQAVGWLAAGKVDAAIAFADDGIAPWRGFSGHVPAFLDLQARSSIDLYCGDGEAAARRFETEWRSFRRSLLLRAIYVRVSLLDLRGRSSVAAAVAATGSTRRRWLGDAEACAAHLAAEPVAWAHPLAHTIRAGVAEVRGNSGAATASLAAALVGYEAADMALHAEVHRLVLGGRDVPDRDSLRRAAYVWMASEAVVAPDRLVAVLAPGFAV